MSLVNRGPAASVVPSPLDVVRIAQAFDFVARAHTDQRRKGDRAEPYLNHLSEVACLVADATAGNDPDLVIAALLHDAIEDVGVTYEQLAETFGEVVASVVTEVTDDKRLAKAERKQRQVQTAPQKSDRAKMIKIADKTSNLRALVASPPADWTAVRKRDYVIWSSEVVAGCRGISSYLEKQFSEACRDFARSMEKSDLLLLDNDATVDDIVKALMDHIPTELKEAETGDEGDSDVDNDEGLSPPEFWVPVSDIPRVVAQLDAKGGETSFAVLMFKSPFAFAGEDPYINLQYSIDGGTLGLDWVLLGARNIEDKERISKFITDAGYLVVVREENDVPFLRVEDGDLAELGTRIVTEFYQFDINSDIRLLVKGFEYHPGQADLDPSLTLVGA